MPAKAMPYTGSKATIMAALVAAMLRRPVINKACASAVKIHPKRIIAIQSWPEEYARTGQPSGANTKAAMAFCQKLRLAAAYLLSRRFINSSSANSKADATPHSTPSIDFVLTQYVNQGVEELDSEKLSPLLRLKYNNAIADAVADLGKPEDISKMFSGFQTYLYQKNV